MVKPILTASNKACRVAYCESFIEEHGCFRDLLDRIDIDEKWWYITEVARRYIVVEGEVPPDHFCKHKSRITK